MQRFLICLFSMSWQASIIILVVLGLRKLLSGLRISKRYNMLLWILPFFFLIFPWKVTSPFGFWKQAPSDYCIEEIIGTRVNILSEETGDVRDFQLDKSVIYQNSGQMQPKDTEIYIEDHDKIKDKLSNMQRILLAFEMIWGTGIIVLLLYILISFIRLKRRLVCSICIRDNIYCADDISTPIVVGIYSPKIYIPSGIEEKYSEYAIQHEQTHIRRKDPLSKMLVFLITSLHWFNPIVWIAYHLFCKDMEMICDEETIQRLGQENREDYANALILLSAGKRMIFTVPLAFGEGEIEARIKNIFILKKAKWFITISIVISGIFLGMLFVTKSEAQELPEEVNTAEEEITKISETEEDFYWAATFLSANEVEQYAMEIKNLILNQDWAAFSEKIAYPITIDGIICENKEAFLELEIDNKIKSSFIQAIESETCRQMFCRWSGISMGNAGQIWIGSIFNGDLESELKIIGINGMFEE